MLCYVMLCYGVSASAAEITKTSFPAGIVVSIAAPGPEITMRPMPRAVRSWTLFTRCVGHGLNATTYRLPRCHFSLRPSDNFLSLACQRPCVFLLLGFGKACFTRLEGKRAYRFFLGFSPGKHAYHPFHQTCISKCVLYFTES